MGAFPVFDKCCFCVDLKTGCFIIGYLSLVGYLCLAVMSIFGITVGGVVAADDTDPDNQTAGVVIMVGSGLILLFTILLLTFIIVLLVGLHKNKPNHVKAYLIYACIYIGISILLFIMNVAGGKSNGGSIVQSVFSILFAIYFTLVIRSQWIAMKTPERGPAIYNTA